MDKIFFLSAVLLSTFIIQFSISSSISLSYFNLAVLMRKCLGKHSCMRSQFSIAILNGTCSLLAPIFLCGDVPSVLQLNYKHIFAASFCKFQILVQNSELCLCALIECLQHLAISLDRDRTNRKYLIKEKSKIAIRKLFEICKKYLLSVLWLLVLPPELSKFLNNYQVRVNAEVPNTYKFTQ